ncbi:MAG TPA: GNAT family N-acetyltransferase [Methylomirabilota bacterium]|nr:GNAT family N-acetyltransferase [Methylomirabilota bacterium]
MLTENLITAPGIFPVAEAPSRATGVQWINPLEHSDWDGRVADQNHPARSFFHSAAWANVLTETYGYKPVYFVTNEFGALHSLLPLMEVDSGLTGKRAVALPFTDNCDPLCADTIGFKELFRNAVEFGKLSGWKYLEFRGGRKFLNGTPPSLSFYGHSLDLPPDENAFFGSLKSSVRRAIRKSEKEGVRTEISGELDAVKTFYSLQCKARKKHGLPPQPFSFFRNIHRHVLAKNLGIVVLARRKKTPVAGAIFFHSGGQAIYKFGASDETFQHLRGNNLVMWEAIRRFARCGVKKLDLGRTSIGNEGLRRFKLGWSAEEKFVNYFRFSLEQEKFVASDDEASGWHNRVFRALPAFASRMIGEILYRHWA